MLLERDSLWDQNLVGKFLGVGKLEVTLRKIQALVTFIET